MKPYNPRHFKHLYSVCEGVISNSSQIESIGAFNTLSFDQMGDLVDWPESRLTQVWTYLVNLFTFDGWSVVWPNSATSDLVNRPTRKFNLILFKPIRSIDSSFNWPTRSLQNFFVLAFQSALRSLKMVKWINFHILKSLETNQIV